MWRRVSSVKATHLEGPCFASLEKQVQWDYKENLGFTICLGGMIQKNLELAHYFGDVPVMATTIMAYFQFFCSTDNT